MAGGGTSLRQKRKDSRPVPEVETLLEKEMAVQIRIS